MSTEPMTFDVPAAAEKLGGQFTVDWLRDRAARREIPHIRSGRGTGRGGRISFTEEHLRRIVEMFTVEPEAVSRPGDFTPLTRGRRVS